MADPWKEIRTKQKADAAKATARLAVAKKAKNFSAKEAAGAVVNATKDLAGKTQAAAGAVQTKVKEQQAAGSTLGNAAVRGVQSAVSGVGAGVAAAKQASQGAASKAQAKQLTTAGPNLKLDIGQAAPPKRASLIAAEKGVKAYGQAQAKTAAGKAGAAQTPLLGEPAPTGGSKHGGSPSRYGGPDKQLASIQPEGVGGLTSKHKGSPSRYGGPDKQLASIQPEGVGGLTSKHKGSPSRYGGPDKQLASIQPEGVGGLTSKHKGSPSRYAHTPLGQGIASSPAAGRITIGKPTIVLAGQKKPLSLRDRAVLAKKAQTFAKARADKLTARAEALAASGDTKRAGRMQALADKATGNLDYANKQVEKIAGAVQKRSDHMAAAVAKQAGTIAIFKQKIADRQPGGADAGDAKGLDMYQKLLTKATGQLETQKKAMGGFSSKFEAAGSEFKPADTTEKFAQSIIEQQTALHKSDPDGYEPAPKMEDINVAMGRPPGGLAEIAARAAGIPAQGTPPAEPSASNLAQTPAAPVASPPAPAPAPEAPAPIQNKGWGGGPVGKQSPLIAPPTAPAGGAGGAVASAPATGVKSKDWGGPALAANEPKPTLLRGKQGGWYYELKNRDRTKVYVDR